MGVALICGAIALVHGFGPVVLILGVWFVGSALSVLIASTATLHAGNSELEELVIPAEPMRRDLTAKELALWDADLAAEAFEADMAADAAAAAEAKAGEDRKTA